MPSPAERFRNELSQRLCVEGNFSMPNTNILLGVIIAGMEHNLNAQHHPISETTLLNVLKVSKEIECFGRILHLKVKVRYKTVEAIPSLTLQTLRSFSLSPDSLLAPCPKIITYLTYSAIVHRLSAYIGPQAVRELIKDFNRTVPNKKGKGKTVRKVPGVGPRIDVAKSRDREQSGRRSPVMFGREKMLDPMCSVERLADPMGSMERLVDAHPVMCSLEGAERPLVCFVRDETGGQDILVPEPRRMASRETLKDTLSVRQPRHARSWETFAPARTSAPPIFLSLPARSPDRPYPYPCRSVDGSIADSGIHMPDSPTTSTSSSASKRRSIRGIEYIRNKLERISKIYSSEISFI